MSAGRPGHRRINAGQFEGTATGKRFTRLNRPPESSSWAWMTAEMLESPAWRALPPRSLKVIMRVVLEHLKHGGMKNGKLPVTYSDFEQHGVRRRSMFEAIHVAIALGFLDCTEIGKWAGDDARRPSLYGLTWLLPSDRMAASNRWTRIETTQEARAVLSRVKTRMLPLLRDVRKQQRTAPRTDKQSAKNTGGDSPVIGGESPLGLVANRHLAKSKLQQNLGGESPLPSRLWASGAGSAPAASGAALSQTAAQVFTPPSGSPPRQHGRQRIIDGRARIRGALVTGALGTTDLMAVLGLPDTDRGAIDALLFKMVAAGELERPARGRYALPGTGPI